MSDDELEKIAEETWENVDYPTVAVSKIFYTLRKVRDAQENRIAMLEANEAVQNVLIADLRNQIKIAREALNKIKSAKVECNDFDGVLSYVAESISTVSVAKEALERMGVE